MTVTTDNCAHSKSDIEAVADAIDAARYAHPRHPRTRPHPFSEADEGDREYSMRLARAALAALPQAPADGWQDTALKAMDAEITRLRTALEIIAGRQQCIDNCLGHVDVARLALDKSWPGPSSLIAEQREVKS